MLRRAIEELECGEEVRWLSRDQATDLRLPGNDLWMVDSRQIMFNVFDGDGRPKASQISDDPAPRPSPNSGVQQARQALADRLRDLRVRAGLTATGLARAAGWHQTKVSKLEHTITSPSVEDLRVWCRLCDAEDEVEDLTAVALTVSSAYADWKRRQRNGLRQVQESYLPLWERTTRFRLYEPAIVPGLFQAPAYAEAVLRSVISFNRIPDDLDEAVEARMYRRKVLEDRHRTFAVIIEEQALRTRYGGAAAMATQLSHLLTVMTRPNVSLGVIPSAAPRDAIWPLNGFWIYDAERVITELLTAEVTITQPSEIAVYERAFAVLTASAVHGTQARALIQAALQDLR
ncbi:helix-turn-helix domain-containing protein [Actinocorallia sp. API 0066]|uniref:helix-turn-helix domain-containing protein n=1 Tax=Actinocorallia sp. API 0066 TaxID=2896846 RepID=UPI001E44DCEF|nr:helix-turn-helix transcriptional regulator [Actinocorallia sp. API 0066]MCD0450583.1 helix-turn-helix domain-containing protein [Actinocorallia sp. API 0066]